LARSLKLFSRNSSRCAERHLLKYHVKYRTCSLRFGSTKASAVAPEPTHHVVAPENPTEEDLIAETQRIYAEFALKPSQEAFFSPLESDRKHVLERMNYSEEHMNMVPEDMWAGTCGAGDHFRVRKPKEGGKIGDMGSGLGFDMIIAANIAGANSKVVGFDFTPVMHEKAKENCERAGVGDRVEFVTARIDAPLEDKSLLGTFDHIMSNGVFNLCTDKAQTMKNLFDLLKPGGQLCFSDTLILPIN